MCCATGICGPDIDPELVAFASLLGQLEAQGVKVERHNLAQAPMAFAANPAVKALLESEGTTALPLVFWDGKLELKGRYPGKDERPLWFRAAKRSTGGNAS
jgi:hypothetical protein